MLTSKQKIYYGLPKEFRTPNCAKTQNILADAYTSKPMIKSALLEDSSQSDQELEWLKQLRLEGKVKKATKVCRIVPTPTIPSPPPLANVQREFNPDDQAPILIEDEEIPIAEISKGSDTEFQVYTAQIKTLEQQVAALQQKQIRQSLKSSAEKYRLRHVQNDLASLMRKMKKLQPLLPKGRNKRVKPPKRTRRRAPPRDNPRLAMLRRQRANKQRVMMVNQRLQRQKDGARISYIKRKKANANKRQNKNLPS